MPKIRQEQIDFTGLSFSDYATKSDLSNASGTLDTKINTLSGNFNNYATTTVLGSASGTLNSKIDSISGVLNSKIPSIPTIPSGINDLNDVTTTGVASGNYLGYNGSEWVPTAPAGGVADHGLLTGLDDDDHSYIYYNKTTVNTMSGYLKSYTDTSVSTLSGFIMPKVNISGGLGGVTITTPANGQVLTYNGSIWVNQNAPTSSGSTGSSTPWNSGLILVTGRTQIATGTTDVSFAEQYRIYDSVTYTHSTSSNPNRVTVKVSGYYLASAFVPMQFKWNSGNGDFTRFYMGLYKNNTSWIPTSVGCYKLYQPDTQWISFNWNDIIINLNANDYITLHKLFIDGKDYAIDLYGGNSPDEIVAWMKLKYLGT